MKKQLENVSVENGSQRLSSILNNPYSSASSAGNAVAKAKKFSLKMTYTKNMFGNE